MIPKQGESLTVYIVRKNGAVEAVLTNLAQAEDYMRSVRRNGEFWRIQPIVTIPHKSPAAV